MHKYEKPDKPTNQSFAKKPAIVIPKEASNENWYQ